MSIVFCDSFDSYSATTDLSKKWGNAGSGVTFGSTTGRFGGGAVNLSNSTQGTGVTTRSATFNSTKLSLAFWLKIQSSISSLAWMFGQSSTPGNLWRVGFSGSAMFLANSNQTASAVGTINVCDNAWHWIELQIQQGANPNKLYVDGTLDINSSTNLWAATAVDRLQINGSGNPGGIYFDDLIAWDDASPGLQYSSIPIGSKRIAVIRPNGDVSGVQFVPNTGSTNYTQIDEVAADNSDYVSSQTSGDKDLYEYENLPFLPSSITAAVVNSAVENSTAGNINFKNVCKSGATESDGPSTLTPASLTTNQTPYETDPNTAAAWTKANLDAAQFGITVV